MKFLQIKNTFNEKPKILEMGVDFEHIYKNELVGSFDDNYIPVGISECFQSRPLIEIDEFREFNLYMINASNDNIVLCTFNPDFYCFDFNGFRYDPRCKFENIGSIFDPENQAKYPKLYQEALDIIYKTLETKI